MTFRAEIQAIERMVNKVLYHRQWPFVLGQLLNKIMMDNLVIVCHTKDCKEVGTVLKRLMRKLKVRRLATKALAAEMIPNSLTGRH